jgi:hypothetical protein
VSPASDVQLQEPRSLGHKLEQYAAAVERFLQRHKAAVIVVLGVLYFGGTMLRARGKPFWFDELLTLLAARQPTYSAVIQAARELDLTPPLTDIVAHTVDRLAGSGEIMLRVPAMVGFWIFCLCLFGFAARRVNMFFALVAMLLPFVTSGKAYSFEARSYGMMLGFCGVALWSWQTATLGKNRIWSLLWLALGIGGAVSCHYYAVLIYLPLVGAEAFRSARLGKIDGSIWAAFIAGGVPLLGSLIWVMRVAKANQHAVLYAAFHDYLDYYVMVFGVSFWFIIPALVLCTAWVLVRGDKEKLESLNAPRIPDHELLAATLFLLIPVAAITLAIIVPPHMFVERYALLSIGGFALDTAFLAAHFAGKRLALGMAVAIPVVLIFLFGMTSGRRPLVNPLQKEPLLRAALERGPVVVNDYVSYVQFWYYAPVELRPRLLYLSDEDSSVKYSRIDDIMQLFQRYGVPVINYSDFATPGKEFLLYYTPGFGWVPEKVVDDGASVQVLEWASGKALLQIRLK